MGLHCCPMLIAKIHGWCGVNPFICFKLLGCMQVCHLLYSPHTRSFWLVLQSLFKFTQWPYLMLHSATADLPGWKRSM
jgi:hypothetical protein